MKRFISGFVTASLLFGITALAASPQAANIFYNNIKIKVYGQEVDTEGNEPFILNDRTYVPARYVAEAMGGEVQWNGETNTVEVVKAAPVAPEPNKLTSDGLEAVYNYTLGTHCLTLNQISEMYPSYGFSVAQEKDAEASEPNYSTITYFKSSDMSKSITAEYAYDNKALITLDEYESVLLPFLNSR